MPSRDLSHPAFDAGNHCHEPNLPRGSGGKSYREVMDTPMKTMPTFRDPAARLEVLNGPNLACTRPGLNT